GAWKILRFGSRVIGDFGSLDILNKEVVSRYFDMFGTKMLDNAGSSAGKSLTHFYNVSWEGSNPNWTEGFDRFFQEKRGYEIWSYLPTLRGLNVGSAAESQRFLVDFYRTISDCFCENCYCQIGKLSHERGILWHSENGGPWPRQAPMFRESDMLTFWGQNDFPQGEFWVVEQKKRETRSNMKYVASASHIYGQKLASVEAFTHMTHHWTLYPDILKVAADSNLIDGANMFIWHTFSNSPDEFGKPGLEYFAGTHINTNVTWFDKVGDFTKYLARCQYLLRQGTYNADFCVYVSDKNYVSWGRGEKWNPNSALVPPAGYAYDFLDTGALLNRLTFEDGRLTLPDGQSYRYLIVDPIEKELPVASLQKILTLVEQGATVLLGGCRPEHDRSLKNYPNNDQEVVGLAEKLWGNSSEKVRALGLGKVYSGVTIPEFLAAEKDLPDFEGPFEYHRRNTSQGVIYFVSGTGGHADCIFRVAGKKPEFWDPMNGTTVPAAVYSPTDDGRTRVTLDLPKDGSVFVVFRSPMDNQHFTGLEGPEAGLTFAANQDGALSCVQWKEGEYRLTTPDGNVRTVAEKCPEPLTLDGPWNVSFDPAWGGPENIVFDKLTYWNDRPEPGIKYYSGTAFYRKTFDVPANQIGYKMELSLGKVGVISRVWINGKEAGILWTDPWTAEISDFVTAGQNELVVEVSNCWANRLIGDAGLPPEQRLTKTNLHLYNKKDGAKQPFQGFSNEDPLRNSGLLGPVQIRFGVPCEIKF
ncbi:MAG: hypothetical protein IKW74_08170, partial [Thermoguttaceae bacterium]|nr:hypothetical protein [Thermoguttaceae bacterium]